MSTTSLIEKYKKWTTYEGVVKEISSIDHQHLSNIIYFMNYVNPGFYSEEIKLRMRIELDKRFNNILLSWKPKKEFLNEISFLQQKGWLFKKEKDDGYNIIINNEWVGELLVN